MKKIISIIILSIMFIQNASCKIDANKINTQLQYIDNQKVKNTFIVTMVTTTTENGSEVKYLDEKIKKNNTLIVCETKDYAYLFHFRNNRIDFNEKIIRVNICFFCSNKKEIVTLNNKLDLIKSDIVCEEGDASISQSLLMFAFDNEETEYTLSPINLNGEEISKILPQNFESTLIDYIESMFDEEIKDIYIAKSCRVEDSKGIQVYKFDDFMDHNIYQTIIKTDNYYYIQKIKIDKVGNVFWYTEEEPIKRIYRSMCFDNTCENIFLDNESKFIKSTVLYTDVDYDLDDKIFELIENDVKYKFNLY